MLADGSGGGAWSQNVNCDIFPVHYTLYQTIKNVLNKMKKENLPNQLFTTWQGRSVHNYRVGVSQNVMITASERRWCALNA
jgi:hypothetical protein